MARNITARILALLLLLPILWSTRQAGAAWYCEGRACGVSAWWCCCANPSGPSAGRDAQCDKPAPSREPSPNGTTLCSSGCNCVMVVSQSTDNHTRPTPAAPLLLPLFALVPAPVALYVAPVLAEVGPHYIEARGPPVAAAALFSPFLRAPPAA